MSQILKIENIEKYYGNRSNLTKAIDGISFDVEEGEFVAIMGASGSGKTTLLNCISTIDRVTSGHKRVNEVARKLDIQDVLQKYPYEMSGGQRQRVASARAIITNPKLVLADEPTGALDSKSAKMLLESFNHLNKEFKTTILMVTHDAFTASYASRVIFIKDGKIFNEIRKGNQKRKEFFDKIIDVVTLLGGDLNDAL